MILSSIILNTNLIKINIAINEDVLNNINNIYSLKGLVLVEYITGDMIIALNNRIAVLCNNYLIMI